MKRNPTYEELKKLYEQLQVDYTKLSKEKSELISTNTENILKTIFNGISDPIYMVDKNYQIIMVNDALLKFQEIEKEDVDCVTCFKLFKNRNKKCPNCYIEKVFKTGEKIIQESIVKTNLGDNRSIESLVYPVFNSKKEVKHVIEIARDVTHKKRIELKLKQSHDTLITILDNIEAIIYVSDIKTYKILFLNKYAKNTFGDVVGKTCYKYLQDNQNEPCVFCSNKELIDKNGKLTGTTIHEYQNTETKRWYHVSDNVIKWVNGKNVRIRNAIDITEIKLAEETLLNSEAKLKELIATKDKFFSIIAHDLKNPFNTMLGFTELLMDNFYQYEADKTLEIINILNETAQNSYRLLENLLEWSKTKTGLKIYNPKKVLLNTVISNNILFHEKSAQNKEIELVSNIKKDFYVKADIDMLNTVLRNLISNALKFTLPGGKVVITTVDIKKGKKNGNVEVSVIDNGIGIRQEDFDKLFRIDVNHSTKGTKDEYGTGLGLILCKEFIEKHNGKIWVTSNKDSKNKYNFKSGCNFSFTLNQWIN